jgi:hypothetical protein
LILIIILQVAALLLILAGFFFYMGSPDSRTSPGKRLKAILLGAGVFIIGSIGVSVAIMVQEQTGVEMGLSGGLESDARQWVSRNRENPPAANQPGDNIRILREGIDFLKSHPSVRETERGAAIVQTYGLLPERPTRLLTRQEEIQYYEGAKAVYELIGQVAGQDQPSNAS